MIGLAWLVRKVRHVGEAVGMPSHKLRDGRLTHADPQLLQFPVDPRRTPERIRGRQLGIRGHVSGHAGRPVRRRLFQVQNRRKPRRCQATTVSGLTM